MALTKVTYSMIDGAVVNALDYGVVAGATDSSAALQAALDTGLAVYLPAGTYTIKNATLSVQGPFFGDGQYETIIKLDATSTIGRRMVEMQNNSSLRSMQIDVNGVASCVPVKFADNATNLLVDDCFLKQASGASVNAGSCLEGTDNEDFKVTNSYLENALNLDPSKSTYHTIYLVNPVRGEIAGNFIRGFQRLGNTSAILCINSSRMNVHHNYTIGGYILLEDGEYGKIDDNIIINPTGDTGYNATNPNFFRNGSLCGNLVNNSVDNGLSSSYCVNINIANNVSRNNNTSGLALGTNAYNCTVVGNSFLNNGNEAFFATSAYSRAGINLYADALGSNLIVGNNIYDDQGTATQQYGISIQTNYPICQLVGLNSLGNAVIDQLYTFHPTADLVTQNIGVSQFVAFTPTVSSASGTITSASASGTYSRVGQNVTIDVTVDITNAGTGSGALQITTPSGFGNAGNNPVYGSGVITSSNVSVIPSIASGSGTVSVLKYDGTTVISTGNQIRFSVSFNTADPVA